MHKLLSLLCGQGSSSDHDDDHRDSTSPRSSELTAPAPAPRRPPSPPHKLPDLAFAPPLSAPELPNIEVETSTDQARGVHHPRSEAERSTSIPSLARLEPVPPVAPSVIPPTPIDPSPDSHPLAASPVTTTTDQSLSPPPVSHSSLPAPASASSLSPPRGSPTPSSSTSNHLLPPASPSVSRSASPARRGTHRRSSSTGSRSFRETLNAYAVEDENGQRCVNQYIIGQSQGPLGRGTYAVVEKAVDRETGNEYAIKEFSKRRLRHIAAAEQQRRERLAARDGGRGRRGSRRGRGRGRGGAMMRSRTTPEEDADSGPDNLDLVRTEVAIMKKVDHPNIASVHEVIDVTSDDALLIMELCRGGPIMKIKDGEHVEPYSEDKARDIFRQLTLGIAYLHHNEIVHRDIKPDNALFSDVSKTQVKLVDFGVSKFARPDALASDGERKGPASSSVAGSPAYMAPELIDSSEKIDDDTGYACDCWSLGVTLYALVAGHLPFTASDPLELFRSIREDDPAIPASLSPALRELLHKLMTRDPGERATIPSLWSDAWLTSNGEAPLPDYNENVSSEIDEPSPAEVHHALVVYRGSTFLALSAAAKFKGLLTAAATRRASAEKEASLDGTTTPPRLNSHALHNPARSGTSSPALVSSPSGSPIMDPVRTFSPSSYASSSNGSPSGGSRPGSRKAPKRFDTVSSLSIGDGDDIEEEEDEGEAAGGAGKRTTGLNGMSGSPSRWTRRDRERTPRANENGNGFRGDGDDDDGASSTLTTPEGGHAGDERVWEKGAKDDTREGVPVFDQDSGWDDPE
ncbi:hypothetical protein JCM10212_003756 [Sporobolomyces blumeae]